MPKCESCFHYDVCKNYLKELGYTIGGRYQSFKMSVFKDKSLIVEALEKQIPKKPKLYENGYGSDDKIIYDAYDCPNCDMSYDFNYDKYDYCQNCGQKLDWSENHDNAQI